MPMICIEGVDGAGKATQARLLADALGGEVLDFPRYQTETGRLIRAFLRGDYRVDGYSPESGSDSPDDDERRAQAMVLQALMTANRYEHGVDLAARSRSENVTVLDRYWVSGYAYGVADGLDSDWLWRVHALLPEPALYVLLDVPHEESFRRRPERRDAYEADPGRLARARAAYLEIFRDPRVARFGEWRVVDGTRSVEDVHAEVLSLAKVALTGMAIVSADGVNVNV